MAGQKTPKNEHNDMLAKFYPYTGYNFCLIINEYIIGFQKVSGLTLKNNNYTPFHQGGNNEFVHLLRSEHKDVSHLVLEKGLGFFNPSKALDNITVMLLIAMDSKRNILHAYAFVGAVVEKVSVSDYNALSSESIIDSTTIMYDWAVEVDFGKRTDISAYVESITSKAKEKAMQESYSAETARKIAAHNSAVKKSKLDKKKKTESKELPPIET